MRIAVCIKQVPDTVDVKLDPETKNLDRTDLKGIINPFDNNAIEEAVQLKEKHGGTVYVVSMGPPQTKDSLKKALAMGCDEAILLSDRALGGADTLATGYPLAKAIQKIGEVDVVLFGTHAVDADTGQTGPIVADLLGYRQITFASNVEIKDGYAYVSRLLEDRTQNVKAKLPVVITATKELNKPRYASPINIMKAAKKEITVWTQDDLDCDPDRIGLKGSPSVVTEIFEPKRESVNTKMLSGTPEEVAKMFVDMLEAEKVL